MIRLATVATLVCFGCSIVRADEPKSTDLADRIRGLDARVILRGKLSRNPMSAMVSRYVAARLRQSNQRDLAAWRGIKTKTDWEQMRDRRMKALRASLGQFPNPPKEVKVRVVHTTKGDGFEVDNLVYKSRPGVLVTANLYRPVKPARSMPGIIVCHSHLRPKQTGARQWMGATWARAGCVVLVPDHLGHGERRQHPFRDKSDYDKPFRVESQDYYFRYDAGIQLHLIGDSLMGWLVWDLSRGVDVLLEQPNVDPKRILMISDPAGGGDVAGVTGALDDRITGVMVNNFGGPEPENGYPLPPDAESWFPYASTGSWEATRNLRLSARDGFLPWAIVGSVAPRRLIYYHEFYWDRQRDPVWKRFKKIYELYDSADSVVGLAGHGFVVGSSPENTHWTHQSRELLYPTLERWFGIANPKKEYDKLIPEERLLCLTQALPREMKPQPLHLLCSELGSLRAEAARKELAKLSVDQRKTTLRKNWSKLLGATQHVGEPVVLKREQETIQKVEVERIQIATESGIIAPVLMLIPESDTPRRIVVAVAQSGKQAFLRERSQEITKLLKAGIAVCLPEVRGTGETDPGDGRRRRSSATSDSSTALMLGQTQTGARLHDLQQILRYVRQRKDVNADRVVLWGDSFGPTNADDCNFAVPRGLSERPHQCEPLGGTLVLLAALFDEKIEAVYVHGGLTGFHDVLASPFCYLPHDVVIPGVLTTGDLCDVAAAIAPRPLRLNGLVNGRNQRQALPQAQKQYAETTNAYRRAKAGQQFSIADNSPSVAQWLLSQTP